MVKPLLLLAFVVHIFVLASSTRNYPNHGRILKSSSKTRNFVCSKNEIWAPCPEAVCTPKTCDDVGFPIPCFDINPNGTCPSRSGCICKEGYVRNYRGICILIEFCPSCGGDRNAQPGCGTNCNRLCSNYYKNDVSCTQKCFYNACDCKDGFVFDEITRICVRPKQCNPQCPENEWYSECTQSNCSPENCTQVGFPIACPAIDPDYCEGGCLCKEGYARDNNGICIPLNECRPKCPENERYSECTQSNCSPENCTQVGFPIACPAIDPDYCKDGCLCKEGYLRDNNGICIPSNQCPSCRGDPNAQAGCGGNCNRRCSDIGKEPGACILSCEFNGCDCREGFYYDDNTNRCVKPEQCSSQCPLNERYSECTQSNCSPENCTQVGFPIACPAIDPDYCRGGCLCKEGYARDENGTCIPSNECPSCGGDPNAKPGCGGNCNKRCSNLGNEPGVCALFCILNGCDCKDGYYYDDNAKKCVRPKDCPPRCDDSNNEVYDDCVNGGCGWRNCSQVGSPMLCIDTIKCDTGCKCRDGYYRLDNGTCVPEEMCPSSCGDDANARPGCGVNCGKRCRDLIRRGPCPRICHVYACDCKDGFFYDSNQNKCVLAGQCTDICAKNEVFEDCSNPVCKAKTCTQVGLPLDCNETCVKKCVCQNGYVRDGNGICIPIKQCPSCGGDSNAQSGCGTNCGRRCPNNYINPKFCPRIACVPQLNKCDCKDGFYYDINTKSCVKPEACSPRCDDSNNEVYDYCVNGGCGWRNCSQVGSPMLCIDTIKCDTGCKCRDGYYRLDNGTCVPEEMCPLKCKGRNEYFSCGSECDNVCSTLDKESKYNCPIQNIRCVSKCYCKDGFARNERGICIPIDQCPEYEASSREVDYY